MARERHSYPMHLKIDVPNALRQSSQSEVSSRFSVPVSTLRFWLKKETDIHAFVGSERAKSRKEGGAESIPFVPHLLMYVKDTRRDERVRKISLFVIAATLRLSDIDLMLQL